MADNPFDQFDAPAATRGGNPFDQFDGSVTSIPQGSTADMNASADELMAGPEGQKLAGELRHKVNRDLLREQGLGPGYAGLSAAGNTAFLNLPRNIIAGGKSIFSGAPFGQEYDKIKRLDEAAAEENPRASMLGDVGGVVGQAAMLPLNAPAAGTGLLARVLGSTMARNAGLGAGLEGAKTFADTKDMGEAAKAAGMGLATGAAAGALGEKVVAPVGRKMLEKIGVMAPKAAIPTTEELFQKGRDAYDAFERAGGMFAPNAVKSLYNSVERELRNKGYDATLHGELKPALDRLYAATVPSMSSGAPSTLTFQGLETIRKLAQDAVTSDNKATRYMGGLLKSKIDDFVDNIRPSQVVSGNSQLAHAALKEGRDYWKRASKAETIEDALQKAEWRAGSTYSGGNINNASRQNLRGILYQDLKTPGRWTPEELAQTEKTVMGDTFGNAARMLGNKVGPQGLYGGAEILMGMHDLATGNLPGAASALGTVLAGHGAKLYGDRVTNRGIEDLLQLVRAGGNRAAMPGVLSPAELQAGRNLAVAGASAVNAPKPSSEAAVPDPLSPAAAAQARGGEGGATPAPKPADTTPGAAAAPAPANEWAQRAPKQLPYGHVFVRDKKTGQTRIYDRTRGQFVGEAAQ